MKVVPRMKRPGDAGNNAEQIACAREALLPRSRPSESRHARKTPCNRRTDREGIYMAVELLLPRPAAEARPADKEARIIATNAEEKGKE